MYNNIYSQNRTNLGVSTGQNTQNIFFQPQATNRIVNFNNPFGPSGNAYSTISQQHPTSSNPFASMENQSQSQDSTSAIKVSNSSNQQNSYTNPLTQFVNPFADNHLAITSNSKDISPNTSQINVINMQTLQLISQQNQSKITQGNKYYQSSNNAQQQTLEAQQSLSSTVDNQGQQNSNLQGNESNRSQTNLDHSLKFVQQVILNQYKYLQIPPENSNLIINLHSRNKSHAFEFEPFKGSFNPFDVNNKPLTIRQNPIQVTNGQNNALNQQSQLEQNALNSLYNPFVNQINPFQTKKQSQLSFNYFNNLNGPIKSIFSPQIVNNNIITNNSTVTQTINISSNNPNSEQNNQIKFSQNYFYSQQFNPFSSEPQNSFTSTNQYPISQLNSSQSNNQTSQTQSIQFETKQIIQDLCIKVPLSLYKQIQQLLNNNSISEQGVNNQYLQQQQYDFPIKQIIPMIQDLCINYGQTQYVKDFINVLCVDIEKNIGQAKNDNERLFLKLLEVIVSCGAYIVDDQQCNSFFNILKQNKLINKFKELINTEVNIRKQRDIQWENSGIVLRFVCIYCGMTKGLCIDLNMLKICGRALKSFMSSKSSDIIETVQEECSKHDNQSIQQQIDEKFIMLIRQVIYILISIQYLSEYYQNVEYLISECQIHKVVSKYIHINCYNEIEDRRKIMIIDKSINAELLASTYYTLRKLIYALDQKEELLDHLIDDNQILFHVSKYIINFAKNIQTQINLDLQQQQQQQQQQEQQEQQTISSISHQFIPQNQKSFGYKTFSVEEYPSIIALEALRLINCLLFENQQFSDECFQYKELFSNLIILSHFQRRNFERIRYSQNADIIRLLSAQCLILIQVNSNEYLQQKIMNNSIIHNAYIGMISTCGGSCEENNDVIISGICAFKDITWNYKLNEGSNTNPLLHKAANEGIEEEGGMEEIESHLFHAVDMKYAYLKEQTIQTKNQLLFHRGFYQQDN